MHFSAKYLVGSGFLITCFGAPRGLSSIPNPFFLFYFGIKLAYGSIQSLML